MLQRGEREGKKERRGEGSLHPLSPTESTSHSAGRHEQESERVRETEGRREGAESSVRVSSVCVRVDCTTASRSPFLQAAML